MIDEGEHRRRCAEANGERRNGDRGERWCAANLSECEPNVAGDGAKDISLLHGRLALPGCRVQSAPRSVEVAESAKRFRARLGGRETGANQVGDPHREMRLDLEIHLGIDAPPTAEAEIEQSTVAARAGHRAASDRMLVTDVV
jgi:hypothetical protein